MIASSSRPIATRSDGVASPGPAKAQTPFTRWNAKRTALFLDHLAATCNVSEALAVSGMSSASLSRRRRECPAFRAAWNAALEESYSRLEAELLSRALIGEEKQVLNRSGEVVVIRQVSSTLGLALLKIRQSRLAAQGELDAKSHEERALSCKMKLLERLQQIAAHRAYQAARGQPPPAYHY